LSSLRPLNAEERDPNFNAATVSSSSYERERLRKLTATTLLADQIPGRDVGWSEPSVMCGFRTCGGFMVQPCTAQMAWLWLHSQDMHDQQDLLSAPRHISVRSVAKVHSGRLVCAKIVISSPYLIC
jgi:hypothetical protein